MTAGPVLRNPSPQIGKIDDFIVGEMLTRNMCFLEEMEERFSEYLHILDWSLYVDESIPHIHEHHVFDADDGQGFVKPQQEKTLEAMGIELPDPSKKLGINNNRKMIYYTKELCSL